ncbi:hypothetical protein H5410_029580 [Solanum commersonii]|uniref:Uncharacterized protein n=1 Tax=Solanum commersonii TaxID=4109 RepID=A0A9J5YDC8_SOLCO|nr:hypothetical protein H5410_029580 [Solanum commersonii]
MSSAISVDLSSSKSKKEESLMDITRHFTRSQILGNSTKLFLAFVGDSNLGLHYVLSGCERLRKLEIRNCPFGNEALLANAAKLETMRSIWMSNCSVSFEACKLLAQKLPGLNVEVIDEKDHPDTRPESCPVEKLYIYRTVSAWRFNTPGFAWIIDEDAALTPYSNGNCSLASSYKDFNY